LLRVYPTVLRAEYADEMTRLFAEQLDDARASGEPWGVARLWAVSLVDLVLTAPGHHFRREEPAPRPVDLGGAAIVGPVRLAVGRRIAVGLLPLFLWALLTILTPGYMDPVFASPPAILGRPAGIVLMIGGLVWMMLGVVALVRTTSTVAGGVVLVVFTVPATFAIILLPAIIVIVSNLAV
jgi:hypothetical protein